MNNLASLVNEVRKQRDDVARQLETLNNALAALSTLDGLSTARGKREVSIAARRKMSQAQKARWAKRNAKSQPTGKPKRTMSLAARRRIAASARARWAKVKAAA